MNLQQLEDKVESYKKQIEAYQAQKKDFQISHPGQDTTYYDNAIKDCQNGITECEEMMGKRKGAFYDIAVNELYKTQWAKPGYGMEPVKLVDGDVIGVEIEYEGENLWCNPINYWKTNTEHSLREYKGHAPVEYAFTKPLDLKGCHKALDYLEAKLEANKGNPVPSPRTSLHVHLNAQDKTWKEIITWFIVYALVEDLLVEYSGKERIGNLFCLRTRDTHYLILSLEHAIKSDDYSAVTNSDYRYTSMNFASVLKFGSCEFRSMRSPIPFVDAKKWIDILMAIKVASKLWKNPREVIEYFETYGAKATLKRIFPEPWMFQQFNHPNLTSIMWEAVREVKDVAYASDWNGKIQPQSKPKEDAAELGVFQVEVPTEVAQALYGTDNFDDDWA